MTDAQALYETAPGTADDKFTLLLTSLMYAIRHLPTERRALAVDYSVHLITEFQACGFDVVKHTTVLDAKLKTDLPKTGQFH